MKTRAKIAALGIAAAVASAGSAYAISHVSDYKTNLQNYRACSIDELGTCDYGEVVSPSKYHLNNGATFTVIYENDNDVQVRFDAETISLDSDTNYTCANELYNCAGSACSGLPAGAPAGTCGIKDRCWGGTNHGGLCSAGCPGGACTASSTCYRETCQTGPRDGKYCGSGALLCNSTAGYQNFKLIFAGNKSGVQYVFPPGNIQYQLEGNGAEGCRKTCTFSLGTTSDSTINTSNLSGCVDSGDCSTSPLEAIHSVYLLDPDGEVLAVPGIGPATLSPTAANGDPVKNGDCNRVPGQTPCL